jgi:hypothetical protein
MNVLHPSNLLSGSIILLANDTSASFGSSSSLLARPGQEDITIREDASQRYEFAEMLYFLLVVHNLLDASKERASGCGYGSERVYGSWF